MNFAARFLSFSLLLTVGAGSAVLAQTAPLSSSQLLQGPALTASLTPAPEPGCVLRPARVGVLKIGLNAGQVWTRQTGAVLPFSLGYERRLFPGMSLLATFTSVYDPWRQPTAGAATAPGLTQFEVTTGVRYYLPIKGLRNEAREEFSGPYVGLLANRTFRSVLRLDASSPPDYVYRLQRSNQLVAGYQLPLGQRGFLDASAGLQLDRGGSRRKLAPTAGLTVGLFF